MKVVIARVGQEPKAIEIENTLEAMQALVGGYIEVVPWTIPEPFVIICNEEGALTGLPEGWLGLRGDIFVTRRDFRHSGEFATLTDVEAAAIIKCLGLEQAAQARRKEEER